MRRASMFLAVSAHLALGGVGFCQEKLKPEAEVSASSGPVKLTLSIYKTHIKLRKVPEMNIDYKKLAKDYPHYYEDLNFFMDTFSSMDEIYKKYGYTAWIDKGDPLWFKLTLTNIGAKAFGADGIFYDDVDYVKELDADEVSPYGIYFDVVGPDGKKLGWDRMMTMDGCQQDPDHPFAAPPPDPAREKKEEEQEAIWKKAGFSDEKILKLFQKQLDEEHDRKKLEEETSHPPLRVEPGQSVSTHAGSYIGGCKKDPRISPPKPIGDFAELWNFHLDKGGVYKVRVHHKHGPPDPERPYPNAVTFQTPYIKIKVAP